MIRTAYPLPLVKRVSPRTNRFRQVQERIQLAARRTRRALQARRHDLAATASFLPAPPLAAQTAAEYHAAEAEKSALFAFYDPFDAFTSLICAAAQEGITAKSESRYQAERLHLINAYTDSVRRWATPYLEAQGANGEAFAPFWAPPTLAALLQNDDGNLTVRMEQSLYALAAWEKSVLARTTSLRAGLHFN